MEELKAVLETLGILAVVIIGFKVIGWLSNLDL